MPAVVLVLLVFVSCTDTTVDRPDAAEGDRDAAPPPSLDSGAADARPLDPVFDGLQAEPGADLDGAREDDLGLFASGERATQTCYDEADNDGDAKFDCDVATCQMLGSCCIGHGNCCEPPASSFSLSCAGETLIDCIAGSTVFGSPGPFLDGPSLALGGDAEFDSGILGDAAIDLSTHRQNIQVTFQHARCDDTSCLESAAVGFTRQDVLSATEHVTPVLALQAARGWVQVRVEEQIVQRFEVTELESTWSLVLRPDGTASISGPDGASTQIDFDPVRAARFVAWGHSRNPSATLDPTEARSRIAGLEIGTALCENPRAWQTRDEVAFFVDDVEVDLAGVRTVTTARNGEETWVFVTHEDGKETLGIETDRGVDLMHGLEDDPLKPPADSTIVDAGLVVEGDATRLFVVVDRPGFRKLIAADWDTGLRRWEYAPDEQLDLPADFRAPSLLVVRDHLVLVGERDSGLALFVRTPGGDVQQWLEVESDLDSAAPGARHPSLTLHGHAYEIHYAHRVGARWRIGLAASDELISWRSVDERVLGEGAGFDRLGARSPAGLSEGKSIRLYYVGQDGVEQRLGATSRVAATQGRFGS